MVIRELLYPVHLRLVPLQKKKVIKGENLRRALTPYCVFLSPCHHRTSITFLRYVNVAMKDCNVCATTAWVHALLSLNVFQLIEYFEYSNRTYRLDCIHINTQFDIGQNFTIEHR